MRLMVALRVSCVGLNQEVGNGARIRVETSGRHSGIGSGTRPARPVLDWRGGLTSTLRHPCGSAVLSFTEISPGA